ncbi:hypothetical protein VOI54_11455 [Tamlana sp. 2201CG12-4]|uniref:hypothetical protein n=1 Tax=Tamlana sp. 2201CG12-4 TaxID=3112582 RepID=UPI002DB5BB16|nr:hypothetical protein [Tamlana sp. 2201CG12-4]MEC3907638.1 hypothetical protein [Tamlana sp. 2201CG12-4]
MNINFKNKFIVLPAIIFLITTVSFVGFRIPVSEKTNKEVMISTLKTEPIIEANEDIIVDRNGNIYVCGGWRSPKSLFKIEDENVVVEVSQEMNTALSITEDEKGNLYITDKEKLVKITSNGKSSILVNERVGGGIISDKIGDLYTVDFDTQIMKKISPNGTVENFVTSKLFNGPTGITYNKSRDEIYVGNWNDGKILLVKKDRSVSEIIDISGEIGRMAFGNNKIYVTSNSEHLIYEISLTGDITKTIGMGGKGEIDGSGSIATFSNPNGIGISYDAKVLYISSRTGGIRKISL